MGPIGRILHSPRAALILALLVAVSGAAAAESPRRVLLLYSFGRDFAPFDEMADRFRLELARQNPEPVEFVDASLEMARFDGADKEGPLLEFLAAIFRDRAPDLIVPVGAPAAMFCHRNRQALFPEAPLLVIGADERRLESMELDTGFTAVGLNMDLKRLLKNILEVRPQTRRVYVVMGAAPLERFWEGELKREWAAVKSGVAFHWLSDQSLQQIRETVRTLPPDSAVLVGIMSKDAAGVPHVGESALTSIRETTNAPVFGWADRQLGLGIVGGSLAPLEAVGEDAAEIAVKLLAGSPAVSLRDRQASLGPPVYDWRELKRWHIPESLLPAGSKIRFRPPGLWETHRMAMMLIAGVVAVQSALIVLLLAARRRAREMDASLSLAADAANIGLWRRKVGSDEFTATPRWRKIFGLPETGRITLNDLLMRLPEDERERVLKAIEEASHGGDSYAMEHRVIHPDGSVHWIASHGRAEGGRDGQGTRGASRDITERKQAEMEANALRQELAHLSRVSALGVLSGSLAHELNQPLGIILSNAQAAQHLLSHERPDLDELREILADIVSEDRRAGDVIRRLHALLRRGETTLQPVAVNETIEEVLQLIRSDLAGRGIAIDCRFEPDLPAVMADRVQLQQVLLNLIVNARDAMESIPAGSRSLTLITAREGNEVHVTVRDFGVGLPENVDDLFKPFHTTKPGGLGMGLAICRTLIAAHCGRLWAEANPDGGAAFHLALPAATESA